MAQKYVVREHGGACSDAYAQEWAGGKLVRFDAHDDGRISRAYLRRLYPRKSTLISRGIKYQYGELALINMELV
jgi:hypothetical protein